MIDPLSRVADRSAGRSAGVRNILSDRLYLSAVGIVVVFLIAIGATCSRPCSTSR